MDSHESFSQAPPPDQQMRRRLRLPLGRAALNRIPGATRLGRLVGRYNREPAPEVQPELQIGIDSAEPSDMGGVPLWPEPENIPVLPTTYARQPRGIQDETDGRAPDQGTKRHTHDKHPHPALEYRRGEAVPGTGSFENHSIRLVLAEVKRQGSNRQAATKIVRDVVDMSDQRLMARVATDETATENMENLEAWNDLLAPQNVIAFRKLVIELAVDPGANGRPLDEIQAKSTRADALRAISETGISGLHLPLVARYLGIGEDELLTQLEGGKHVISPILLERLDYMARLDASSVLEHTLDNDTSVLELLIPQNEVARRSREGSEFVSRKVNSYAQALREGEFLADQQARDRELEQASTRSLEALRAQRKQQLNQARRLLVGDLVDIWEDEVRKIDEILAHRESQSPRNKRRTNESQPAPGEALDASPNQPVITDEEPENEEENAPQDLPQSAIHHLWPNSPELVEWMNAPSTTYEDMRNRFDFLEGQLDYLMRFRPTGEEDLAQRNERIAERQQAMQAIRFQAMHRFPDQYRAEKTTNGSQQNA